MKRPGLLKCAAFAVGFLVAGSAAAQDQVWLRDRRFTEGIGYRTGDVELHPGIGAEVGYDSNFFQLAPSESLVGFAPPNVGPVAAARLRISPSFSVSTLSQQRTEAGGMGEPPKVNFRLGASATYNEFIATQSEYKDVVSRQRALGALATMRLVILPQRKFGADIGADFGRTVQGSINPDQDAGQMNVRLGAGLNWAPGGGLFSWRLVGYEFGLTKFNDEALSNLDNYYHQVNTRGQWKFLPKTAIAFDASAGFYTFASDSTASAGAVRGSTPVRARLGFNGLISPGFSVTLMGGWGASFYDRTNGPNYDGPIGQAEIKWFLTPNPATDPHAATLAVSSLALGFTRDFVNSYITTYYTRSRGYLNLTYFFAGRVLTTLEGGFSTLDYGQTLTVAPVAGMAGTNSVFTDTLIDATLFAEYRLSDSFGINVTGRYAKYTGNRIVLGDDMNWSRFETYLGVRWLM